SRRMRDIRCPTVQFVVPPPRSWWRLPGTPVRRVCGYNHARTISRDRRGTIVPVEKVIIGGVVRDGLVIPDYDQQLPEGAHVEIILSLAESPAAFAADLEAWERASDEAWALID